MCDDLLLIVVVAFFSTISICTVLYLNRWRRRRRGEKLVFTDCRYKRVLRRVGTAMVILMYLLCGLDSLDWKIDYGWLLFVLFAGHPLVGIGRTFRWTKPVPPERGAENSRQT